ncbi:MAG: hypothetical protein JNL58_26325 [Planctomyces sp.]|nr:hypothetical protein [Planctomyces sp.]
MRFSGLLTLFMTSVCMFSLCSSSAFAQSGNFPYEARVVVDELFARSGAGDSWHATQKVARDTIVKVHRHDPGGWYMIEPPAGSFSWIPSSMVDRISDTEGSVSKNSTVVYVGSEFGDDTTVWQRSLNSGDKVTIRGERKILTLSGEQNMLQIDPPRREFRWIPGSGVVPVDENRRRQMDTDPYATPSNATPESVDAMTRREGNGGGVSDVPPIAADSPVAKLQLIRSQKKQLADLDQRFREMLSQDPSAWNLDVLESEYRSLQQSTSYKPIAGQIDLRYPAIERYRRKQAEFQDFRQRTSQTEMRDAELVAQLRNPGSSPPVAGLRSGNLASGPGSGPGSMQTFSMAGTPSTLSDGISFAPTSAVGPESAQPAGSPILLADAFQSFGSGGEGLSAGISPDGSSEIPVPKPIVGAGIVQRTATGEGASHVLMNPSGKVLAYLKPSTDLNLDLYLGQQVGVQGNRMYQDSLKSDVIEVSGLEAVRLRQ